MLTSYVKTAGLFNEFGNQHYFEGEFTQDNVMTETQIVGAEVERVNKKLPLMFDLEDYFYSMCEKSSAAQPVIQSCNAYSFEASSWWPIWSF
jgi:hypothetical protein